MQSYYFVLSFHITKLWYCQYEKLEDDKDVRQLQQGLHAIDSYMAKPTSSSSVSEASLQDEPNAFYVYFERGNVSSLTPIAPGNTILWGNKADVRRSCMRVNSQKETNSDGLPCYIFKTCADQLAAIYVDIASFLNTTPYESDQDVQWTVSLVALQTLFFALV